MDLEIVLYLMRKISVNGVDYPALIDKKYSVDFPPTIDPLCCIVQIDLNGVAVASLSRVGNFVQMPVFALFATGCCDVRHFKSHRYPLLYKVVECSDNFDRT